MYLKRKEKKNTVNPLWPPPPQPRGDSLSFLTPSSVFPPSCRSHNRLARPPSLPPSEIFSAGSRVFLRKTQRALWGIFRRGRWERRSCRANNDKWRGDGLCSACFLRRRRRRLLPLLPAPPEQSGGNVFNGSISLALFCDLTALPLSLSSPWSSSSSSSSATTSTSPHHFNEWDIK